MELNRTVTDFPGIADSQDESTVDSQTDRSAGDDSSVTNEETPVSFPRFDSLPLELQAKIFEDAIPSRKSPVVDFFFKVNRDIEYWLFEMNTEIPGARHLMPLLKACETSRKAVYLRLKEIKISEPPEDEGFVIKDRDGLDFMYYWTMHEATGRTFIDPLKDILMLNIPDLLRLYRYGRSMDLSSVERIALTFFGTDIIDHTRPDRKAYVNTLELVRRICPDMKFLQIVSMLSTNLYHRDSSIKDYHMIDFDSEMSHIEYLNEKGDKFIRGQHAVSIRTVLDGTKVLQAKFSKYLRQLKLLGRLEDLKYWQGVTYSSSFHCRLSEDLDWKELGKNAPEPRLYVMALNAWLPAHADGIPLDKYKGLAQIFDGAPW